MRGKKRAFRFKKITNGKILEGNARRESEGNTTHTKICVAYVL
jgi:hypothetical protein